MTMETAVIAGVGPGLGSSLARAFGREGYAVALISRRSESSEPVAEQIRSAGGKAIIIPADVTQRQAVLKSVERASAELGSITALAYNASGYGRGAFFGNRTGANSAIFRRRRHGRRSFSPSDHSADAQRWSRFHFIDGCYRGIKGACRFCSFGHRQVLVADARSIPG